MKRKREKYNDMHDDDQEQQRKKQKMDFFANDEHEQEQPSMNDLAKKMLEKMGWQEGKPLGRGDKIIEPIDPQVRPKLAGLGSSMPSSAPRKDVGKMKSLETFLMNTKPKHVGIGTLVNILDGPHDGLFGRVLREAPKKPSKWLVRLQVNRMEVKVNKSDVQLIAIWTLESDHAARVFARQESIEEDAEEDTSEANNTQQQQAPVAAPQQPVTTTKKKAPKEIKWVCPGIRIKIISKTIKDGSLYLQKATVEDVPDMFECTLRLDNGKLVEHVTEDMIETVIPKNDNALVYCVLGKYKGKVGRVVDRDRKALKCAVQMDDDIFMVPYDDISEYVAE